MVRLFLAGCCFLLMACVPSVESEAEDRSTILEQHQAILRAHLEGDPQAWAELEAEAMLVVNRGELVDTLAAERLKMREGYLSATEFDRYEDMVEPRIYLSEDGKSAWLAAQVAVVGRQGAEEFADQWAWVELWEKRGGQWKLVGNASNRRDLETAQVAP